MHHPLPPPSRILLIKPSSLGDVTHALPILHLLRKKYPNAKISWLVAPYCSGLLEGHPDLDEVILFDRRRFGTAWKNPAAGLDLIRFKRDLRRRQFDWVIDLQGLFRSGWLAWFTRAPVRIGFANAREFAPFFYTHRIPIATMEQHAVDRYLRIALAVGCEDSPVEFPFALTDSDRALVRQIQDMRGRQDSRHLAAGDERAGSLQKLVVDLELDEPDCVGRHRVTDASGRNGDGAFHRVSVGVHM